MREVYYMKFNKKAAMELGISTVVMLVIAIVIIGAGIAFIRGFFGTGTDTLVGAFEVADFGLEPTAARPLVLTDGQMTIKRGREATVRVGFYNRGNDEKTVNIAFGRCVSSAPAPTDCDADDLKPSIVALEQKLAPGDSAGFATQVSAECVDENGETKFYALAPGTYTCNLLAVDQDKIDDGEIIADAEIERTQIIFTVTS